MNRAIAGAIVLAGAFVTPAYAQMDHSQMDHSKMDHGDSEPSPDEEMPCLTGTRIVRAAAGSGTSRLPGNEGMMHGIHLAPGDWMIMLHGYAWSTYSNQGGPRGDKQAFVTSMAMAEASRDLGMTTKLQLRAMLSLDPLIGKRGYPNLFATGETANGIPLVDRQHPHDFFMELSARVDQALGGGVTGFLYGGPVAEPALGPSAFMHRRSAKLNPEAPITHHWFDSTHITFGVVTAGIATSKLQLEASAFRGREPDEERWGIESPKLDSWSVRATWNPSPEWAVSVSHGFLKSPEAREPLDNERRTVAAINYASQKLSVTAAYSHKIHGGDGHGAFLAEANWDITPRHALFGRFETVENGELFDAADPVFGGVDYRVSKATLGYAYTVPLGPFGLSLGGSASVYAKPSVLDAVYGQNPKSFTLFAKLGLGG